MTNSSSMTAIGETAFLEDYFTRVCSTPETGQSQSADQRT